MGGARTRLGNEIFLRRAPGKIVGININDGKEDKKQMGRIEYAIHWRNRDGNEPLFKEKLVPVTKLYKLTKIKEDQDPHHWNSKTEETSLGWLERMHEIWLLHHETLAQCHSQKNLEYGIKCYLGSNSMHSRWQELLNALNKEKEENPQDKRSPEKDAEYNAREAAIKKYKMY